MKRAALVLCLFLVCLSVWGCGDSDGDGGLATSEEVLTLEELSGLIEEASRSGAADADGDTLPDCIESEVLGSDPARVDSDGDGIFDNVEIFGEGGHGGRGAIPDRDRDGRIAPLDDDDDGDGVCDGELVDSDGDGIPDYLEFYGFTYCPLNGAYALWDGTDFSIPYYKTDPHQKSTDQDPYADDMEISGTHMDVSVKGPGDLPMVPALPGIVVRLEGYRVTLKQDITWTEGQTLGRETSWETATTAASSRTDEHNWELGYETKASFSLTGVSASVAFHANYGGSIARMHETSTSHSRGGSSLSQEQWVRACTTNPTEAAHLKLFLKVYNQGTACASNVVPTLTLRIGGHNIATFEPGNARVNLIEPGGVYPADPGVYWTVDCIDTGTGTIPLTLTLNELRALESGAPISLTLTQMAADVMQREPVSGAYVKMGDWNEYRARCASVCANLYFDAGDGSFVHALVYAGDGPTAPRVTLGDAFVWGIGGHADGEGIGFPCPSPEADLARDLSLEGWSVCVDGGTCRANGVERGGVEEDDLNVFDLRLFPGSVVVARAPRPLESVDEEEQPVRPEIFYAYYDRSNGSVNAVVGDYNGIGRVEFIDKDGHARAMDRDIAGSSFYVYYPLGDKLSYPDGYVFDGSEEVVVVSVKKDGDGEPLCTRQTLAGVYVPRVPEPTAPSIEWVYLNTADRRIEALIVEDLDYPAGEIMVHHPLIQDAQGNVVQYADMQPVADSYRRPNVWCYVFDEWFPVESMDEVKVIAVVCPGLYSESLPTTTWRPHHVGANVLWFYHGWCATDEWWSDALDLDDGSTCRFAWTEPDFAGEDFPPPPLENEIWVVWDDDVNFRWELRFNKVSVPGGTRETLRNYRVTTMAYDDISCEIASAFPLQRTVDQYQALPGDVYVMETGEGHLSKMMITRCQEYGPAGNYNRGLWIEVKYMVYGDQP